MKGYAYYALVAGFVLCACGSAIAADTAEKEVRLGTIVITPIRIDQFDYEAASNVSIITQEDLRESNARFVADILRERVGVHFYDQNSAKNAKIDIRGFADTSVSNVLVMVNGRKVNSIDISGPDWLQIPVDAIDHIEVVRGAASVLYGDNAVGGVINIVTKKGRGPFCARLTSSCGSYGTFRQGAELQGEAGPYSYYLFGQHFDTDGYRENSALSARDANMRLCVTPFDRLALDLSTGWHDDEYRQPGGLNQAELDQYGRRGSANQDDYASSKDRFIQVSAAVTPLVPFFDYVGTISVETFYKNRDTYAWFDYGSSGATATKYMIDGGGITAKYAYTHPLFGRDFNLVSGVDYYTNENTILGSGKGLSVSTDNLKISKEELGVYTYSEGEIADKLFLSVGGRFARADYGFDQVSPSKVYVGKTPQDTVTMGGLTYRYAQGSEVHVSAQETFRFLATDEWYSTWTGLNTGLKQQHGIQYEAGIKHNLGGYALLSVTPYLIHIEDEIFFNPYSVMFGENANYDRTMRKGIECGVEWDAAKIIPLPRFVQTCEVFGTYTYQAPTFDGGEYDGNDIPMVPRHQASAGLRVGLCRYVNAALTATYVGSCYAINDTRNETATVKAYYLLDARVSYLRDWFEVFVGVNNLLDRRYNMYVVKSATSVTKDYFPAPERNYVAGVSLKY